MLYINVEKKLDKFSLEVELKVEKGLTVLLGPSGCGKSTLLNLVAGMLSPDKGEILLDDKTFFRTGNKKNTILPVHLRRIGYVLQYPALFPHLNIKENILYGLPKRDVRKDELPGLLELLRLEGLENRLPSEISGGQAQRAALARAVITHPSLMLLDEPFSALDNFIRRKLRHDMMAVLQRYDIPAILVTHDLEDAVMLGEKIAVMDEGRILQYGSPKEIFTNPKSRKVARFMGMRNIYEGIVRRAIPGEKLIITGEKFEVEMEYRPLKPSQKVVFGIRPEDILYLRPERDQNPKENTIEAEIVSVIPHGPMDSLLLKFTDDAYDLEMLLPRHVVEKRAMRSGETMRVSLPKKSLHILDA